MKKIGIIGAMELEVSTLKEDMTVSSVTTCAGMDFYEGTLNDAAVVIVRSGVGKVNAALCVQILTDKFAATHIINTGYKPGEVPQLGICEFVADAQLASLAIASCKEVNPDLQVHLGRVVSGDQFISSSKVKERLIQVFHGDCAEMEGASIAQSAYLNHVPFVIIRAISDKADGSAEVDYPVFEEAAARHSARLVADLVKRI